MPAIPKISVILPVYNAEKYIKESIDSILDQTYKNFELIIINDGSKDNSEAIIKSIKDDRIVYISHNNIGLAATLNRGLEIAKGDFIARQDNDDISYPTRFEKQINYFNNNKNCGLLGTWAGIIDENGNPTGRFHKHSYKNEDLKLDLCFDNCFVHSSIMFRKEVILKVGIYNAQIHNLFEDYEYWFRISKQFEIANIPEILLDYREVSSSISRTINSFRLTVANQSKDHLTIYFPESRADTAKYFAYLYHGIDLSSEIKELEKIDLKKSFSNIIDQIYTDKRKIIGSENKIRFYENKLRYLLYSYFRYDKKKSIILRLYYKIILDLMILFNKNLK